MWNTICYPSCTYYVFSHSFGPVLIIVGFVFIHVDFYLFLHLFIVFCHMSYCRLSSLDIFCLFLQP